MVSNMRKSVALILLLAITSTQALVSAQKRPKAQKLTEEQRIVHVLNRLGFGARPGDVERVKALGLENYINQQLNPEKIADSVAENKVRDLSVLNMTTAELYEKYPQPGQLLRQLQARGMLPAELAEARENRLRAARTPKCRKTINDCAQSNARPTIHSKTTKYREMIEKYYRENGLQRPQRIIGELQASRILRAVYSERQLQEVMVDFWTNHFNIFANKGADRWLLPLTIATRFARLRCRSSRRCWKRRRRVRRCCSTSITFRASVQTPVVPTRSGHSDNDAASTKTTRAS